MWCGSLHLPCRHTFAQGLSHVTTHIHRAVPVGQEETLLQALKQARTLVDIRCVHHLIIRHGLEQNLALGNTLLQVYGRSGRLDDVWSCFNGLGGWNHVSWNFVIRACARYSDRAAQACFRLFREMHKEGVAPTKYVFASVLSACCNPNTLTQGRILHELIIQHEFDLDVVIGTALVSMYGKSGSLEDSWKTFKSLSERNAVCWNVIIGVNVELGYAKTSLSLMKNMQQHAIAPEKVTFLNAFKAYACVGNISEAKQMHACVEGSELSSDTMVMTAVMKMYGKFDLTCDVQHLFDGMPEKDLVSWNALIALHAQQGHGESAIQVFKQMQLERVQPNTITLISILDACAGQSAGTMGKAIHHYMVWTKFNVGVVLGTSLLNMYGKCVSLDDACGVFDTLSERNVVCWNAMLAVSVQNGDGKKVVLLLNCMQQDGLFPDEITFLNVFDACGLLSDIGKAKQVHACFLSCHVPLDVMLGSALVDMYGQCGDLRGAIMVFDAMSEHNAITFANLLSACADLGALNEGKRLHALILERKMEVDLILNTALVNLYGKCGMLETAWKIFHSMPDRSTLSWNAMIGAVTQHGQGRWAVNLFKAMTQSQLIPDETTFISLLSACSHTGLVVEGYTFFHIMTRGYGLEPILDHYNCLLDMLARAGRLDDAEDVVKNMPFWPTRVSWATLLGACQNQMDLERGAIVADHIFGLNPQNPSAYVTLANVYATGDRGDLV